MAVLLVLALSATPAAAGLSSTPEEPPAAAQETSGPPPPASLEAADREDAHPPRKDGRRTLCRFPANFGRTTIGVFHRDNLVPLAIGGTATAIGTAYDEQVRDSIASEGDDLTATLSTLFGGIEGVAIVGSVLSFGARVQRLRPGRGPRRALRQEGHNPRLHAGRPRRRGHARRRSPTPGARDPVRTTEVGGQASPRATRSA